MRIFFLLILSLIISTTLSSLMSSSKLERCSQSYEGAINCTSKFIIAISLENGQMNGTEAIATIINSVKAEGKLKAIFEKPLHILVEKSEVIARYTIVYRQDFNYKPVETVITSNVFSCKDGDYDSSPNCGWQHDSTGERISNSQGFCCDCEFWEIIGLSNNKHNRAKDCGALNIGEGSATAHCLRFSDLWYSGYEIIKNELYYTIRVRIYEEDTMKLLAQLELDSTQPIVSEPGLGCIVKIIGDLYPSQPAPELNHLYLLIPSKPRTHPLVLQGSSAWMLVNAADISFTGLECNKIGVSYTAFQMEASKCRQVAGSCLNNQIYHLYNNDLKKINEGKTPQYILKSRGDFKMIEGNDNNIYLAYHMTGRQGTIITIEIPADKIKFITNVYFSFFSNAYRGKGVIDSATIQDFEALSNDGILLVQVTNIGNLTATYYVGVQNCSKSIKKIAAIEISLEPQQSKQVKFRVYTNTDHGGKQQCAVTLTDASGQLIEVKEIGFDTIDKNSISQQDPTNQTKSHGEEILKDIQTKGPPTCKELCPDWYNVPCFFIHRCDAKLGQFFTAVLAFGFFLVYLYCCIFRGQCRCCCNNSDSSPAAEEPAPPPKSAPKKTNPAPPPESPASPSSSESVDRSLSSPKALSPVPEACSQIDISMSSSRILKEIIYYNVDEDSRLHCVLGRPSAFSIGLTISTSSREVTCLDPVFESLAEFLYRKDILTPTDLYEMVSADLEAVETKEPKYPTLSEEEAKLIMDHLST